MNTPQEHSFHTQTPIRLYVEIGSGSVRAAAGDSDETTVSITGRRAEEVRVTQDGDQISVVAPKGSGGFFNDNQLHVVVNCPTGSDAAIRTGSADVALTGAFNDLDTKTGSGDVAVGELIGDGSAQTGSGDVRVDKVGGGLRVKCGSGDVRVGVVGGDVVIATGSGDVSLHESLADAAVKTGSGDLYVERAAGDVSLSSGSGDLRVDRISRGKVTLKGASSDTRIGVPAGTPVWTDISTISGSIRSNLETTGAPAEGQDHVEVRVNTVSGDVELVEA